MDGWPLALFADATGSSELSPTLLGVLVLGIITLLNGALSIKHLFEKRRDKESVPRSEYDELKARVTVIETASNTFNSRLVEYVTRRELDQLRDELSKQYSRIERYARARNHKLTERLGEIQLNVEVLHRNLQKEIGQLIGQVSDKMEKTWVSLCELRSTTERRLPHEPHGR